MNEDTLNMEVRKYLKKVGVTSQREIEHAIAQAIDAGKLSGSETLDVSMTLDIPSINLSYNIKGEIGLE